MAAAPLHVVVAGGGGVGAVEAVVGLDDVFAAGDGATFPLKQGGIACQMADAIAVQLAARAGAEVAITPFSPVLRRRGSPRARGRPGSRR